MHPAIPKYLTREYVRQIQMALNEKNKMNLPTTGRFNAAWAESLKRYQIEHGLLPTAKYDDSTREEMEPFLHMKYLQEEDYNSAAVTLGCDKEIIQAIVQTCMSGSGFISSGKCRIVFNRERFYAELKKRLSEEQIDELSIKYPNIVQSCGGGYLSDDFEYARFCDAVSIDSYAAMVATSWGMYQLPGANYRQCGFKAITAFAVDMQHSERRQLQALVCFFKSNKRMHQALVDKKWADFCREYFGPAFSLYRYDQIMKARYIELIRETGQRSLV